MTEQLQGQVQRSLLDARFEVLPLRGVTDQIGELAPGSTVTVTSSPTKGPEATLDLARRISGLGLHVVPHLAARSIVDTVHLAALLDHMAGLALTEAFVVAGDAPTPAGAFPDALALLRAMDDLGRRPARVGITGYPERHAYIPDPMTVRAMADKSRYADYIVSQICYDARTITAWVQAVRARGISLPIYIGVPGVADPAKLMRVSLKIGLGESIRFLRKQHGAVSRMLTRYTPEDLVEELSATLPGTSATSWGVAGWHFFTFNEISRTRQWRDDLVARLKEVPA